MNRPGNVWTITVPVTKNASTTLVTVNDSEVNKGSMTWAYFAFLTRACVAL